MAVSCSLMLEQLQRGLADSECILARKCQMQSMPLDLVDDLFAGLSLHGFPGLKDGSADRVGLPWHTVPRAPPGDEHSKHDRWHPEQHRKVASKSTRITLNRHDAS